MRLGVVAHLLLSGAIALQAQEPQGAVLEVRDLRAVPRDIADEVQQIFNAPRTRRVSGDLTVSASDVIDGDLAVVGGQVAVNGRVTGRIIAINGNVVVRSAGRVDGTVIAIGGTVSAISGGEIAGTTRSYPERVLVEASPERVVVRDETDDERWYRRRMTPREGSGGQLRLVTARTYNRVEGLPLLLGPRAYKDFSWGRVTADAMGVLRSADRFQLKSENLGHMLRVELQLGGDRGIRLAGRLEDVVSPVEDFHLSDSEVGIASFLLHRDYRDYYNRHGGSISAGLSAVTWTRPFPGRTKPGPCLTRVTRGRSCETTRTGDRTRCSMPGDSTCSGSGRDTTRGTTTPTRGPGGTSPVNTSTVSAESPPTVRRPGRSGTSIPAGGMRSIACCSMCADTTGSRPKGRSTSGWSRAAG